MGEQAAPGAAGTLETHVWRLRRLIEPGRGRGRPAKVLINDSAGYRLVATSDQVDSARFEQLCLLVVDLLSTAQPERGLRAADDALALWRGTPFEAIADRDWAVGPIARLAEMHAQLLERRIDAILATGQAPRAVAELESLLTAHPFRERLWWQRMVALYRTGRVEQALDAYRHARQLLLDEIGMEPGRELVELQHRMLNRDPSLELTPAGRAEPAVARTVEIHLPRRRELIGRAADQDTVISGFETSRLVTSRGRQAAERGRRGSEDRSGDT